MAETWLGTSELVVGLLMENKISLTLVRPELFFPPYDTVIKEMKKGRTPEELIEKCGFSLIQASHEAVMGMNGLGESINWVSLLEKTKSLYEAGQQFGKWQKKLERGEDINWCDVTEQARKAQIGISGDFIPLSEVEGKEVPFISSGWPIIDEHLGGWPEVGMILVGGDPGIGKTTFAARAAIQFAKKYPEKKIAFFTLEMMCYELAMRFREIEKIDKSIEDRILLNDVTGVTADEIINKVATIENLGMIIVDFADQVVKENSEPEYSKVYKTFSFGAKQLYVPIIVLVQLVKTSRGGIPKPIHIRYTGMAESFAWMILMLYDPSKDWETEGNKPVLPYRAGSAYILGYKIRGGFRKHLDDAPGAIHLGFSGKYGWSVAGKSFWRSLKKIV